MFWLWLRIICCQPNIYSEPKKAWKRKTTALNSFFDFTWHLPTVRRSHWFWRSQPSARVERNWCIEEMLSEPKSIRSISIHCFGHSPEELYVFVASSFVIHTTKYFAITLLFEWKHVGARDKQLKSTFINPRLLTRKFTFIIEIKSVSALFTANQKTPVDERAVIGCHWQFSMFGFIGWRWLTTECQNEKQESAL